MLQFFIIWIIILNLNYVYKPFNAKLVLYFNNFGVIRWAEKSLFNKQEDSWKSIFQFCFTSDLSSFLNKNGSVVNN